MQITTEVAGRTRPGNEWKERRMHAERPPAQPDPMRSTGLARLEDGSFAVTTRRDMLKAVALTTAAAAGVPWALAACGGSSSTKTGSAAAAAGTPKRGGTLTFAVDGLTGNLDPGIYTTFGGIMGTNLVGKCLTFLDYHSYGGTPPQPALATSWETSSDGRIYRFNLRQGVKFHDGTTLTANDCVRSFERLMNPKDPSRPAGTYAISEIGGTNIKKVTAVNDQTFEVTLGVPDYVIPVNFGRYNATILSAAAIDKYKAAIGTKMITAGPFEVVSYTPNQGMTFKAFQDYYEGVPYLDTVVLQIVPDSATLTSSLQSGSVNASSFVAFSDLPTFSKNASFVVQNPAPTITLYLGMNLKSKALHDIRVRQAINYAIDREALAQAVFFGYANHTPAGLIPPPVLGHDPTLAQYSTLDVSKAKALLKEAGGNPGPILFHISNTEPWSRIGQIVVQNLQQNLGLTINANYIDPAAESATEYELPNHDLFLENRGGALPDPSCWTENYETGAEFDALAWDISGELPAVQNQLASLIAQGTATPDTAKREQIYKEFQHVLLTQVMDSSILGYYSQVTVSQSTVHNLDGQALGGWALYGQKVWLS